MNTESKSTISRPAYWERLTYKEKREWSVAYGQPFDEPMPNEEKEKQITHYLKIAFVVLIIGCALGLMFTKPAPRDRQVQSVESDLPSLRDAYAYMQRLMLGMVKAPTQTSFQPPEKISMYHSGTRYRAEFWVDSPNGFGVMLRVRYTMELSWENGDWVLLDMDPPHPAIQ